MEKQRTGNTWGKERKREKKKKKSEAREEGGRGLAPARVHFPSSLRKTKEASVKGRAASINEKRWNFLLGIEQYQFSL